jgi:beta-phosphoglucomutase-like phosphatase (HAD superfamily)
VDGVLVDGEHRWYEVRAANAASRGRPWGHADQQAVMGGNSREWSLTIPDRPGVAEEPDAIQAEVVRAVVARFRDGEVDVMPGAVEAVRRIAARLPVAIASSAHPEVVGAAAESLGRHGVFGALTSSDAVERG